MSKKTRVRAGAPRPSPTPAGRQAPVKPGRARATVLDDAPFGFAAQRWLLILVAVGVQVLVMTNAADPVNVTKLTLVLLVAIALLGVAAMRVAAERGIALPAGLAAYAALAFGVAAVITTAIAPAPMLAVWGDYLRNAGLALYLACLVLFVAAWRSVGDGFERRLAFWLAGVGGLLAFYSLLQHFSIDPIPWQQAYADPVSTFGNPDFAGAFYAIALPFAVWAGLWGGLRIQWRALCGVASVLLVIGVVVSGAAQGYVAALAALFLLLLGWLFTQAGAIRRRGIAAWGVAAVIGFIGLVGGLASAGPFARLGGSGAVSIRRQFWDVAATMFAHHPIVGVGMSTYGDYFRYYRSPAIVSALGYTDAPDAPHSVPIAMFANGGLLLGVSYAVFVIAIAIALVRALRRDDRAEVLLTSAYGAGWLAFQVQSSVSLDVVPLVTLHFVFAGIILARSGVRTRTWSIGGQPAQPRRRGGVLMRPAPPGIAVVASAVVALVVAWFAIQPLRADVHSSSAASAAARGDAAAADDEISQATSEAPWQGVYWLQRSKYDGAVGRIQTGLADLRRALAENPRDVNAASSLARVEAAIGDQAAAAKYFRVALKLDPLNPDLKAGLRKAESAS